jgi:DNA-binding transcriptional regulator YbjK
MPANPVRRRLITDAAIDILVDVGSGGVNHRQVDERAQLPPGTTSNYFRTRLALLEATAARVAELHWQGVDRLQGLAGQQGTREDVAAILIHLLRNEDVAARRRALARYELFIEGTRRPELQPILDEIASAAKQSASLVLKWGGLDPTDDQIGRLGRLLNGIAFTHLTVSPDAMSGDDPVALIEGILRAVFDG